MSEHAGIRLDRSRVEFTEVDGEIVALDVPNSSYFSVDGSGSVLWRLLCEGTTGERLRDELVSRYGIDAATADADVSAFLSQLDVQGLLVRGQAVT